ncbi:hypothetical protein ACHQM5_002262 [Ranunculus cassubicifolius]
MAETSHLLEINLISAQGLKPPKDHNINRRFQIYAVAWVDSSSKLRTRVDRIGGVNPTWNDKFIFRVTNDFISSETSAVTVEIYSIGILKDCLIGTSRFFIGTCLPAGIGSPARGFGFGVRRPSGKIQGVLNIGSVVINPTAISLLNVVSAAGYRDLMGYSTDKPPKYRRRQMREKEDYTDENYCDSTSCGEFSDNSSICSTSSSTSNSLKNWMMRSKTQSNGLGLLCGLGFHRRSCSSETIRSDQIVRSSSSDTIQSEIFRSSSDPEVCNLPHKLAC